MAGKEKLETLTWFRHNQIQEYSAISPIRGRKTTF